MPISAHQLPIIALSNSVMTASHSLNQTPRLSNSEYNTSSTKPKHDYVPYVNTDKTVYQSIEELKTRYEEMCMAVIELQTKIQRVEQALTRQNSKPCPICLECVEDKIAYFDCGHWICELCLRGDGQNTFVNPLTAEEKQALCVELLMNQFRDKRVVVCSGQKLSLKCNDQTYVLHFDSQVNLYRDPKNNIVYNYKPKWIENSVEPVDDQTKPPLHLLFNQKEEFYAVQCPLCKIKSCHQRREDCYKIVYF